MNYSLRKARLDDFEILYQINKEAYKPYVEQIWGWNEEYQYNFFKEHIIFNRIELIMADDKPVGFTSIDYRDNLIFGESIAILPEYQSKGIGTKVINELIAKSKQMALPFYIQVFKVNERAKKLYELLGFEMYGETETHYKYKIMPRQKTWFEAFSKSMNVIFTDEDFKAYLADIKSCIDFYRKYLGENTKILDLGCGLGTGCIPLSTFGYRITGIDSDERVVEAARKNAERFGKDVRIVHGDVFDIDKMFGPDSFDACMSGGLLEHFPESQIQELIRKQLIVAPKLVAYMPIASFPGEKWSDDIYRNLWSEEYWLDVILKEFNIVHHSVARANEAIGGFLELEVVLAR
jgi:SAM-dependent methyltransferase/ribosomal protein S18 acetylase RimI-like enzyme